MTGIALVALTLVFALVNGMNDGAAINAAALKVPGFRPLTTVVVLAAAIAVVPLIVGTAVARTLVSGLVDGNGAVLAIAITVGVLAAMAVVAVLTRMRLPTSLTLAVVGGIVGAGIGLGLPARWATVGRVGAIGVAAPLVGGLVACLLVRLPVRGSGASLRWLHGGGVVIQSTAYAANDGQKILAVALLAVGALNLDAKLPPSLLVAIALCFAVGAVVGLRAASGPLAGGVLRERPRDEVTVEYASAFAVLGSAALGAPVSMTQSIAGGLVGIGVQRGQGAVRWRVAASLVVAWVLTLPAAGLVGGAAGAILRLAGAPV